MPGSRGAEPRPSSGGVTPRALADWEARAFAALRRQRDAATPVDDELPDDPLADSLDRLLDTASTGNQIG